MPNGQTSRSPLFPQRLLKWIAIGSLLGAAAVIMASVMIARRASPVLRARVIETLQTAFDGRVELDNLQVVSWRGFEVTGGNLRIYAPASLGVPTNAQPLLTLRHFDFHAPWLGLLLRPIHVGSVKADGLDIELPPVRHAAVPLSGGNSAGGKPLPKMEILVDEIICDNSRLVIANANPQKGPKLFELQHIELHRVGPSEPWNYTAQLMNAIPRGEIQAQGKFGPWQADTPANTAVTGHYTFEHADLGSIKGLGGILSSVGDFEGKLDRITVDGTTQTPQFSLDIANHPVPLETRFHAIVDGTTGDTYLQPVNATLRNSKFTAAGSVVDVKGVGHTIDLEVEVPAGHLQDFLDLAVQTQPAVLTAIITTHAHVHIAAGKPRVVDRLSMQGKFHLRAMHFTNPDVQDKVDMLSYRAQGEPEKAKPGAPDVASGMTGTFDLQHDSISFPRLVYTLPGAQVNLAGVYSMDGQIFDFRGHVLTDLPLSKMVQGRWASLALRVVNPFFHRPGGGADIPVRISGTRSAPKFGLDIAGARGHGKTL